MILSWLAGALLLAPPALQQALDHYQFGDYAAACGLLTQVREDPGLARPEKLTALRYLGACHHVQGELPAARAAFDALLEEEPAATLDPVVFPPDMVSFFREVQTAHGTPPPTHPDGGLAASAVPPVEPPPGPSRLVAALPFGAGQFQNGETAKGAVLASLDALALGIGVVGLALFESEKESGTFLGGGEFSDPDQAHTYENLYVGGFVAFVGLWAYGVIDAMVHYPGTAAAPSGGAQLWLRPDGLGLGGSF